MAEQGPNQNNPGEPDPTDPANGQPPDQSPEQAGAVPPEAGADELAEAAIDAAQDAVSSLQGDVNGVTQPIGGATPPGASQFPLPSFGGAPGLAVPKGIDLLSDVNLHVKIELGRTRMLIEDVLKLGEGAVVELDKLAGDPVDVYVNDRHIAKGEVLVLNDNFCVRINEIVKTAADAESVAKAG